MPVPIGSDSRDSSPLFSDDDSEPVCTVRLGGKKHIMVVHAGLSLAQMTWLHTFLIVSETDMDEAVDLSNEEFPLWAKQLKEELVRDPV
jgi:hypothetical protein